jgi:hypothetical protein
MALAIFSSGVEGGVIFSLEGIIASGLLLIAAELLPVAEGAVAVGAQATRLAVIRIPRSERGVEVFMPRVSSASAC